MSVICEELLIKKRFECDPLADNAVAEVVRDRGENILRNHELYSTVKELGKISKDSNCARFMEFYEQEPPFNVEWKKCELGRRFFVRNSALAGLVLMYCSLVSSFTAAYGNKVYRSLNLQSSKYVLLTSCHMFFIMLVVRIWCYISLLDVSLYSHYLPAGTMYCCCEEKLDIDHVGCLTFSTQDLKGNSPN